MDTIVGMTVVGANWRRRILTRSRSFRQPEMSQEFRVSGRRTKLKLKFYVAVYGCREVRSTLFVVTTSVLLRNTSFT